MAEKEGPTFTITAGEPQKPPAVEMTKPVRTKAPAVRRTSVWEPDPRWAHPIEAALWVYFVGLVASRPVFEIPPWTLAITGPIFAAVAVGRARRAWSEWEFGEEIRTSMTMLATTSGLAAGGWLVWACYTSPLRALGWLALLTVWFGGWYAVLRTSAPKRAAEIADAREEAAAEAAMKAATETWTNILAVSGLPLKVVEARPTRAGYVLGVDPIDINKPVSFATLESKSGELTTKASALLSQSGVTVGAGAIRFEETESAHVHLIHVCTKQILRESITFEAFEGPATIAHPVDFALYEDGQEVAITLGGKEGGVNGKIVGATGSGKTVSTNSKIGRIGECGDVLVGVVASNKLVPLTYPWLKPWLEGKTDKPALDFVAGQDPEEVLLMLAAIYAIVCDRNAKLSNQSSHVPTPEAPAIVCFVEEAGKMAIRKDKVTLHDGMEVGFSQLVHMIAGECRSAQVSLFLMNQNDLYGALGEYGSEIARNTPYRECLKTLAPQDGMSVLPGLKAGYADTSKLRFKSMLVQPSIEDPRVMPAKAYHLEEDLVGPIAERNAEWRPELESDLAHELGEVWLDRWDAERLPELAAAARRDGLEWPVGQISDPMDRPDSEPDDIDRAFWGMVEQEQGRPAVEAPKPVEQPKPAPSSSEFPDVEAGVAELNEIAARPALTLPEPLASVMSLLSAPQAPRDFISTRQLAILLDRVPAEAPDYELREAARKLGRELSTIDEEIRTIQRGRLMGLDIPALRQTAARIARGGAA